MREVAVVGFAQRQMKEMNGSPTCVELLVPIFAELFEQTGWTKSDIDFWCSGSSDYLAGRKPVAQHHRVALARALKVDARIF